MVGTLVNATAIAAGGATGLLLHKRLPERLIAIAFQGIGLVTLAIGVSMSLRSENMILAVASVVAGAVTGELMRLEERMNSGAEKLKKRLNAGHDRFTEGMVTASLLYCVGSMSILGSIEDGLGMQPRLLFTKSIMDGVASVALTASFGVGAVLAVIPVFLLQGSLTLLAGCLSPLISETMVADFSCVGGVLLLGLGINILDIKKIAVANMLPSLLYIIVLSYFFG